MQFKNIFLLLLTGFLLFGAEYSLAQKITTNENGDKIILYPDGSWRYFDSRLDSNVETEKVNTSNVDRDQLIKEYRRSLIDAAERAAADEKLALRNYEDVQFDRVLVEEELSEATKNSESTKAEINEIKARLKEAEEREDEALANLGKAVDAAKEAEDKTMLDDDAIYDLMIASNTINTPPPPQPSIEPVSPQPQRQPDKTKKVFAAYNEKDDVMINPPDKRCELTFDGVDEFSGKKRKQVKKEILFSHTADEMRPFFRDKDYLTCHAYLSSLSGGYTFLSLEITIASNTAQRDYGIIEKGSVLNLKLMDDTNIKLFNNKTDVGIINELDNSVTYNAQYLISSGAEKMLRKNEIDKIRVIWSSGYEDYEVYDLDFFINQFNCLNDK